jgi:hypothetical protein
VDGPYAGQTFTVLVPYERIRFETAAWNTDVVASPLVWIVNGPDHHCHQLKRHRGYRISESGYHLVYRDTFGSRLAGATVTEYGADDPAGDLEMAR